MIWLAVITAIIIVSFFLALRSMKNYQEIPPSRYPYGIFLIQNPDKIQNGILNKLYDFSSEANAIISLEKLFKGGEHALVIFAPQNIIQFIPELELLEIEDYLSQSGKSDPKKTSVEEVITWSFLPKNEDDITLQTPFLTDFPLDESQSVYWQLVLAPHKRTQHFQVNIRVMVVDPDVHKRIELTKNLDSYIGAKLNLQKKESSSSMSQLYASFQKRALIPSEIEGFVLSTQKIKELI